MGLPRSESEVRRWILPGILVMAALPFLFFAVGRRTSAGSDRFQEPASPETEEGEQYFEIPAFSLSDQDGEEITDALLKGDFYLANFFFTRCTDVCPPHMAELARLQRRMEREGWKVRLVSFTVDPAHDTPEVLKAYGEDLGADWSGWSFLTGPPDTLLPLLREGFKVPVGDPPPLSGDPLVCDGHGWEMGRGEERHCMCDEGYQWDGGDDLSCVQAGGGFGLEDGEGDAPEMALAIAHPGYALLVNPEGWVTGILDLDAPDWALGFPIGQPPSKER